MEKIVFQAEPRKEVGTRAARRIRASGRLPANIYGHGESQILVSIDAKEFTKFLDAGHRIVTVRVDGKEERSVVKEVQYDALGSTLIHVDFTRITKDEKIQMSVPVETIGAPKGLSAGGVLVFPLKELDITGLPDDIPEHFPIRIEALEMGQAIRIKDLTPPERCEFAADPESVVIMIAHPREEAPAAPVEAQAAQPEVIGKKKEEPAEGAEPDTKKKDKEK
jgi:large subunit ribosomal protein L25